jgi:hypothetical protein
MGDGELTALADRDGQKLEFILAVPARRYAELVETFRSLAFTEDGLAEASFAGHRLIVARDPLRAEEQSTRRRARIAELEAMADKMVARLDAQDVGQTARGRRASDRGAYSRFTRAVAEAELTRFLKADYTADRFSYSLDEDTIAEAELFDGKLALITNAPDLDLAEAVARYKALADIERGFRVLKSDIEIAPVHHRLPDRIRAHALICFLALVLHRVMRMRLKARGHSASPRTALDLLARIHRHQARIAERSLEGTTRLTPEQLDLFDALTLPKPA